MIMWKSLRHRLSLIIFLAILLSTFGLKLFNLRLQTIQMELQGEVLDLWVAKNTYQHYKGLGGRESFEEKDGLIMIFPQADKYAIVMRDMEFPIDVVWFSQGKVVDMAQNLPPEDKVEKDLTKYYPRQKASLILELPAGWISSHGLKIGDEIRLVEEEA